MTTVQKSQIKPGIVADRHGEKYWFSGSALVPTRYDNFPIWGSGFTYDSQLADQVAPFTQVSVLSDAPRRHTPTAKHSPVNKAKKHKIGLGKKLTSVKLLSTKPIVTAVLVSIALTVAINLLLAGSSHIF